MKIISFHLYLKIWEIYTTVLMKLFKLVLIIVIILKNETSPLSEMSWEETKEEK